MTRILQFHDPTSRKQAIEIAAGILHGGGTVAFPTETVYGLGAPVTLAHAVEHIFAAKGRPASVPLIVHVLDLQQARQFASHLPPVAEKLARAFWPGPLSLIVPKADTVPPIVSAGGPTVAFRAPDHSVALELIRELGQPIAAPSANRFNRLPPVEAAHVHKDLGGRIDAILDGGRCPGGLESTVLDLAGQRPRIVRRGAISVQRIRAIVEVDEPPAAPGPTLGTPSAGWVEVRYPEELPALVTQQPAASPTGLLLRSLELNDAPPGWIVERLSPDVQGYAADMYRALHRLYDRGCVRTIVEAPPPEEAWSAIHDRFARLASVAR